MTQITVSTNNQKSIFFTEIKKCVTHQFKISDLWTHILAPFLALATLCFHVSILFGVRACYMLSSVWSVYWPSGRVSHMLVRKSSTSR